MLSSGPVSAGRFCHAAVSRLYDVLTLINTRTIPNLNIAYRQHAPQLIIRNPYLHYYSCSYILHTYLHTRVFASHPKIAFISSHPLDPALTYLFMCHFDFVPAVLIPSSARPANLELDPSVRLCSFASPKLTDYRTSPNAQGEDSQTTTAETYIPHIPVFSSPSPMIQTSSGRFRSPWPATAACP